MALELPEIGPFLGRLTGAPPSRKSDWVPVDDVRMTLATRLFKLAGSARIAGDGAPDVLTRTAWSDAWHQSVVAVVDRVITTVEGRLRHSAAASRYPRKRLEAALLTDADKRALTARLGEGGTSLISALDEVERLRGALGSATGLTDADRIEWLDAVTAAARRQESAWSELELALEREEPLWSAEIGAIRGWVRPSWPLWITTALLYGLAIWLGLVLGGYLPAPRLMMPAVTWFWERF